jgi:hypothetical protein
MSPPADFELDLDSDGKPDVIVRDTNGKEVFLSLRFIIVLVTSGVTALAGAGYYLFG